MGNKPIKIAEPLITDKEIEAVIDVIKSKNIACGDIVKEFEKQFADKMECKYAVAVSSGTAALCIGLKALDIRSGQVITTPFSFFASSSCIFYNNAIPEYVDIDKNFLIDVDKIEQRINSCTKAILPVSLFGRYPNANKIQELAKKYNLKVIYDNCQAHNAEYNGIKIHGDICCYSLYPTKNMTTGEGGMICTNNEEIYIKLLQLRNHGQSQKYIHETISYNYRMTNINAAIGIHQLKRLSMCNFRRKTNAEFYNYKLKKLPIILPEIVEGHVFNQYTIRLNNENERNKIIELLNANKIGFGIYYPTLLNEQPAINIKANVPFAEEMTKEVLSLPVHPKVSKDDIALISEIIKILY